MSDRAPGTGRYAHPEREQRWLLDELPVGLVEPVTIVDRYVIGTTLRLRRAEDPAGRVTFKFGQKVRPHFESAAEVRLTNFYLREDEHEVLQALPARELGKVRWHLVENDRTFVVDVFSGPLAGLVLAELELLPGEMRLESPHWARVEVTDDDRYSGGRLAELTEGDVAALQQQPGG
jgi:CYTH domain-containing protein